MMVYVTTLGRVGTQITLDCLRKNGFRRPVTLVVQDHEYDTHRAAHPGYRVLRLPAAVKTLGPTRKYLLDRHRGTKLVMLDDDLLFYHRPAADDWHLRYPPPGAIDGLFDEVEDRLDRYAHVGVSAREGNNRVPHDWTENTRYMRLLAYNTRLFPRGVEAGRVDGMSDFDLALQLLRAGRPSAVCFRWAQGQPGTQTPGGCSLNRTHDTHGREVDRMLRWHAPFVRERVKRNKTGGDFGTRREVTVLWKEAFESSKK